MSDKLSLQLGLRWEYLAPWAEQNGVEAAFDAATGKIGYNALPTTMPAALVPLVHQQEGYFPDGILQKDFNNWGPRVGVAYNLTDRMVLRSGFGVYYDNLNLNELQFTRLIPPYYGQYSLNPPVTRSAAGRHALSRISTTSRSFRRRSRWIRATARRTRCSGT